MEIGVGGHNTSVGFWFSRTITQRRFKRALKEHSKTSRLLNIDTSLIFTLFIHQIVFFINLN